MSNKYCMAGKCECGRYFGLLENGVPKFNCEWVDGDFVEISIYEYCPWPHQKTPKKPSFREIICRYYEICVERSYRGGILNEFWFGKANAIDEIIGTLNKLNV